jgi:hypothetical protein
VIEAQTAASESRDQVLDMELKNMQESISLLDAATVCQQRRKAALFKN